ncbi:hypothetical protein FV222_14135 [Methylobacterium sp. WL103]|nr:hypothetical protein FV226_21855 [Methylobacterium sp. WL12]TXM98634.1 hypothetical protein FV222_14135 [Methylobacterium sp. WL103]
MQPGSERRSRSGGEGEVPDGALPSGPPHLRLPPRFVDDTVDEALSPRAGRGDARLPSRPIRGCVRTIGLHRSGAAS